MTMRKTNNVPNNVESMSQHKYRIDKPYENICLN